MPIPENTFPHSSGTSFSIHVTFMIFLESFIYERVLDDTPVASERNAMIHYQFLSDVKIRSYTWFYL